MVSTGIKKQQYKDEWEIQAKLREMTIGRSDYELSLYAKHDKYGILKNHTHRLKEAKEPKQSILQKVMRKEPEEPPTIEERVTQLTDDLKDWVDEEGDKAVQEAEEKKEEMEGYMPEELEEQDTNFPDPDLSVGVYTPNPDAETDKEEEDGDNRHRLWYHEEDNGSGYKLIPTGNLTYFKTEEMREREDGELMPVEYNDLADAIRFLHVQSGEEPEASNIYTFLGAVMDIGREDLEHTEKVEKIKEELDKLEEAYKQAEEEEE